MDKDTQFVEWLCGDEGVEFPFGHNNSEVKLPEQEYLKARFNN